MLELTSEYVLICESTAENIATLFEIYMSNPDLVRQNEGSEGEPGRYDLDRWLRDWHVIQLMPGSHRLGCYLRASGRAIGIVDFLEEHTDDGYPWLGTLILHRDVQRQGLGTEIFQCLAAYFHRQMGWSALRAGVKAQNAAGLAFLQQMGFQVLEQRSARFTGGIQPFFLMERALEADPLSRAKAAQV
jgi:RimJ/RimL family protein N-acetyltransferase